MKLLIPFIVALIVISTLSVPEAVRCQDTALAVAIVFTVFTALVLLLIMLHNLRDILDGY